MLLTRQFLSMATVQFKIIRRVFKYIHSFEQICFDRRFTLFKLRAKKCPTPPLGNFADICYLEDNFKPHVLRDICTLCSGALVSDSLLHM